MPEFRTNYHTHTTYCDGESSPRDIVREAARLGMTELGFSGHSYTSIDESYCMSPAGMRAYYDEIGELAREYGAGSNTPAENYGDPTSAESGGAGSSIPAESNNEDASAESGGAGTNCAVGAAGCADGGAVNGRAPLRIFLGIEMDYFSDSEDYEYDWDYIICSCHYIKKDGNIFPVDESEEILLDACDKNYGGDIYALIADYYNEVGDVIEKIRHGLAADDVNISHSDQTECCSTDENIICSSDKTSNRTPDNEVGGRSAARIPLIIGHFDLITKFNEGGKLFDESDPRYVSAWMSALDRICPEYTAPKNKIESSTCCDAASGSGAVAASAGMAEAAASAAECGDAAGRALHVQLAADSTKEQPSFDAAHVPQILFEINTGAMSRGYRSAPYPAKKILIEIARRGIPVILSSDSHDKSTLLYGFEEASRIAAECGVRVLPTISGSPRSAE